MKGPRIALFAYADVGHACLSMLLERDAHIAVVYTHADAPGESTWFSSVASLAVRNGIPVRLDARLDEPAQLAGLRSAAPDLVLSCYYRSMLPLAALAVAPLGNFNVHGSLLPRYRGRAPVNWAVLNGETETGATLHVMTARADAGDIVDQEAVPIGPDDTACEVQARVRDAAVRLLDRQLDALAAGCAPRRPQDATRATTFGKRRPEDGAFVWTQSATAIHNLVRAVSHPYPGAFTPHARRTLYLWRTRNGGWSAQGAHPGEMRMIDDRLYVACGSADPQWLEIVRAQIDGDIERDGADLARHLALHAPNTQPAT
jgi:methionyl-tRNA formyltransferase